MDGADTPGTQPGIRQAHGGCRGTRWVAFIAFVLLAVPASAGRLVTINWERNPEPDIAGYLVSVGTAPGTTVRQVDTGNWPNWTFTDLTVGQRYYFRVQAYNTSGMVSEPSREVSVLVTPASLPSESFATWAGRLGVVDPNADSDGDGLSNHAEYADGTNPLLSNTVYLTEGATGAFQERIALVNPAATRSAVLVTFLQDGGGTRAVWQDVAPMSRATLAVNDVPGLRDAATSAVLQAFGGDIVAERTMKWSGRAMQSAGHTAKASGRLSTSWFFAEGDTAFFDTYLLLTNPHAVPVTAKASFLTTEGVVIDREYELAPASRFTIYANLVPGLGGGAFSTRLSASRPISAERSMYFGWGGNLWRAGHTAAGVTAAARQWFVAEGRTGEFFDTWVLIANPSSVPARAVLRYLTPEGEALRETRTLGPNSRTTIYLDALPGLDDRDVSVAIDADTPIVVERSMYWPGSVGTWQEAHASAGVTALSTKWALAEGEVGGPSQSDSYVLLANPGDAGTAVVLTALREGGRPPLTSTLAVGPRSRLTVSLASLGLSSGERCGVVVASSRPIAVERSMYWNAGGVFWSGGTNETAVRLR